MLDEHLTFSQQCNKVCNRVSTAIATIYKLRTVLPAEVLKSIYFSLVHSHLKYLTSIWGLAPVVHLKPVQRLQNCALKNVFGLPRLTSTFDLYFIYSRTILPIKGIHELQVLKFV